MTHISRKKKWVLSIGLFLVIVILFAIGGQQVSKKDRISTVAVETDYFTGQGVVYKCIGDEVYVATTAHVLNGLQLNDSCMLTIANDLQIEAKIRYISHTADIAFIMINLDQNGKASTEMKRFEPVKQDRSHFDALRVDSTLYAFDRDHTKILGVIISPWIYLDDFGLNMMLANLPCKKGMSGCGVYDEKGFLAGIICGMNGDETAILPYSVMESEWMMVNYEN